MSKLLREIKLQDGTVMEFFDQTRNYFGNYFLVKIEIVCRFRLCPEQFESADVFDDAKRMIGENILYRRTIEHMGIESECLDQVRKEAIDNFVTTSLPYFNNPDFPAIFVNRQYNKMKSKVKRIY